MRRERDPRRRELLSPFTGIADADTVDPAYQQTWAKVNGGRGDDIAWGLWGAEKLLGAMLQATGRDLTRQHFVNAVNGKTFSTKAYPDVNYSKSRFGGTGVQVLKADCTKKPPGYVTESRSRRRSDPMLAFSVAATARARHQQRRRHRARGHRAGAHLQEQPGVQLRRR